jgi:hypothetical protein
VRISDCYVSVGDDCITIKSGTEHERQDRLRVCRDITITNCTLARGHGGVVIGSETTGGVQNVVISNCVFIGTDRGIRLKSRRGRGGLVEDVRVTNLIMNDVLCPFTMNLYYACGAWGDTAISDKRPHPVDRGTPRFRHIYLSHITARGVKVAAGFLYGLAEMPVEDVSLSDISISLAAEAAAGYPEMADDLDLMQQAGFFARNVKGLRLDRVDVSGQQGPAFLVQDAGEIEMCAVKSSTPPEGKPVIQLSNVDGVLIHACQAQPGTRIFGGVYGPGTRNVIWAGNELANADCPVQISEEVPLDAVRMS